MELPPVTIVTKEYTARAVALYAAVRQMAAGLVGAPGDAAQLRKRFDVALEAANALRDEDVRVQALPLDVLVPLDPQAFAAALAGGIGAAVSQAVKASRL